MVLINCYINGSYVNPPKNIRGLLIELNYGKDQFPQGNTVSITNFEWVRENADWVYNYIQQGLVGGNGIFEAPTFRIDIQNGSVTKTVFDGYIDLTDGLLIKQSHLVPTKAVSATTKALSHATVDWINDRAGGFTFEYLASLPIGTPGAIDSSMYRFMPYVNNSVPNYEQAAICTLMIFSIEQSIVVSLKAIQKDITDVAGFFNTPAGVIKIVIEIAYLLVLIVTIIKVIEDMVKFIISPVKYHAGMYARDLLSKGCEYLGMTFVCDTFSPSSDFYNEFIIPEKLYNAPSTSDSSILGFLVPDLNEQVGWYKGTFGSLLEAMKIKYNAKIIVTTNNEVILIRKDKNAQPAVYQLPDIETGPEKEIIPFTYNTSELKSSIIVEFRTDTTEMNTQQNYLGTIYEATVQPKVFTDQSLVMMKDYDNYVIPFARATTKTGLTYPEQVIDNFLTVFDDIANVLVLIVNAVTDTINGVVKAVKKIFKLVGISLNIPSIPHMNQLNLGQFIENRIGMMVLQNDHFQVAKILILKEGSQSKYNKIHPNNDAIENAKNHWDKFYYVNSFLPASLNPAYIDRPTGNQFIIKRFPKVPFTWQNFLDVFTNNRIKAPDGSDAIIESLKFNPALTEAEMTIRFSKLYTLNLKETFLQPTGA
jgi:hypothetical protein